MVRLMVFPVPHGHLKVTPVQVKNFFTISTSINNYGFVVIPNCNDYIDCNTCARLEECAWCASENVCTTISEAFSKDCRGLVFEAPCPSNFVAGISYVVAVI